MQTLTITRPDDLHVHLRDGLALNRTVSDAALTFYRLMCMPNLVPPVKTVDEAAAYRQRILACLPPSSQTNPLIALYLTDLTTPQDIQTAANSEFVKAVKLYPAGATTNSNNGVSDLSKLDAVIAALEEHQLPLLVHGEVTHADVDIFDREKRFIDDVLTPLTNKFPKLKVVVEHITTKDAADFVLSASSQVAATITPQHLMYNRNHMLVGGIRPHFYCLPILKRQSHQQALIEAATSGNAKFFLGSDSAPHALHTKENTCGCAGCYTAPFALQLYAEAFEDAGQLDKLEAFASFYGADFYGLERSNQTITLIKSPYEIPLSYPYLDDKQLVPLRAGETLRWSIA